MTNKTINIKKIFVAILVCIALASCDDLLTETPDSMLSSAELFSDLDKAQLALNGVYASLSHNSHYGQYEMAVGASDDMYCTKSGSADGLFRDISFYRFNSANKYLEALWFNKYEGLNRANHVLKNLKLMNEYADNNEEALRIEGEACFLRALLAFDLVKYWGDVPFKTEISDKNNVLSPKVSKDIIFNQIIEDLNTAKANLKWSTAQTNPERATQGAARALLMRVQLFFAGYSLNSSATDGSSLTRPADDVRNELFKAVEQEYEEFVLNGSFHILNENYLTLWQNYSKGVIEPKESIFEIGFFSQNDYSDSPGSGMWGQFMGPQSDVKSSYGRANAFYYVLPEWKNYYQTTDVRRDVNICPYRIDASNTLVNVSANYPTPGKWRRDWCGFKYTNNTDVNYVFLRFADVLLMAAEAKNELGKTAEAIALINQVRSRAKAPLINTDLSNYNALFKSPKVLDLNYNGENLITDSDIQGKIRTALFWERGFELCYEGNRKYDLIRWGILYESVMLHKNTPSTHFLGWQYIKKGQHELFPIPLKEFEYNPNILKNNPGF